MVQLKMLPSAALAVATVVLMAQQSGVQATATAVDLGSCSDFAVMASTSVSFATAGSSGNTVAVGSVGVAPGNSITGSYVISDGFAEADTASAINCAASMLTAYNAAKNETCTNTTAPVDLGSKTFTAGVYCNDAGYYLLNTGSITLSGSATDVWIFKAATSVTTGSSTSIILSGGAVASNVFWQVGTTLVTGSDSTFVGTILAGTGITMGVSSTLSGRALAQASVSFDGSNTITSFVAGASDSPSTNPTFAPSAMPTVAPSGSNAPASTPASVAPSAATPSSVAPSASTPSSVAPSAAIPSSVAPSASTPSSVAPSAAIPSSVAPSASTPSSVAPSAATPSSVAPSASTPSSVAPSASTPSSAAPVTTTSLRPSANPSFAPTSAASGSVLSMSKVMMIAMMSLLGVFSVMTTI